MVLAPIRQGFGRGRGSTVRCPLSMAWLAGAAWWAETEDGSVARPMTLHPTISISTIDDSCIDM
eukprot:scaffold262743_cov31-Tisochrysis_lutea.AAC.3